MPDRKLKVLQVVAVDLTVAKLIRPLIDRLTAEGMEVASVCAPGRFSEQLRRDGYTIHHIATTRSLGPVGLVKSTWQMYRLISREKYDIVHVHMPVMSMVGRLAATLARTPIVIYTAHGFYFHERMKPTAYRATVCAERLMGLTTDHLFTQSAEDARAAVTAKIRPPHQVEWISNGVDVRRFKPFADTTPVRQKWGLMPGDRVVGFLGRMVREKGIVDLLRAMEIAAERTPGLVLLVAGDNKVANDRDTETDNLVRRYTDGKIARFKIVFTGFIDEVDEFMNALDLFCLPSYREGMPRSIIEAMACGKPVVATNIRGSREEVVDGVTGFMTPLGDIQALADAIADTLANPEAAAKMGRQGRARAEEHFDEEKVLDREVAAYRRLLAHTSASPVPLNKG